MISKKCCGCGAIMQCTHENEPGYVEKTNYEMATVCRRCFRIKNYGELINIDKDSSDYQKIYNEIVAKKNLFLFLCDILSLDSSINMINNITGNVILVITKCDLLPKSVKEYKLKEYINKRFNINIKDVVFISAIKNYNLDLLVSNIIKYKNGNDVYVLGKTNSGKSTLINQLCKSYNVVNDMITTSMFPATTIDVIRIKLADDFTIIDTPGLIDKNSYSYGLDSKRLKKITPKVEIKPITYQMKPNQSIIIEDYARIDYLSSHNNSFTIYMSNNLKSNRIKINTNQDLKDLKKHSIVTSANEDIVINGLLFCKIVNPAEVNIYVKDNVEVYKRNNLI